MGRQRKESKGATGIRRAARPLRRGKVPHGPPAHRPGKKARAKAGLPPPWAIQLKKAPTPGVAPTDLSETIDAVFSEKAPE